MHVFANYSILGVVQGVQNILDGVWRASGVSDMSLVFTRKYRAQCRPRSLSGRNSCAEVAEESVQQHQRVLGDQDTRLAELTRAKAQAEESSRLAVVERDEARHAAKQSETARQWAQERAEELQTQAAPEERGRAVVQILYAFVENV